jgi:stage II sporulation protein M
VKKLELAALSVVISVFLASLVTGLAYPAPLEVVEEQISVLAGPIVRSEDAVSRVLGLLSLILYNNVGVSVRCVTLGFTLVYPAYVIYANGYILGSVVSIMGRGSIALVPHGTVELPVIIYSGYLGTRLGIVALVGIYSKLSGRKGVDLPRELWMALAKLKPIPLLLTAAALLEVFVSLPISYMLR